ncbi:MAG TPA: VanW family protein [Pedococcus sp.]|nr:VanW family protein [Pedococcus sp.]
MRESGSAALRLGIALVVLAAAYVGAAWFLGHHVPANTTVAGIPVGGMSTDQAEVTLRRAVGTEGTAPVEVMAGDKTISLDPVRAGLTLDLSATVHSLSQFSLLPADLWNHLTGGTDVPLVKTVDRARLDSALASAAAPLNTAPVQGAVSFVDGTVRPVQPIAGSTLSVPQTAAQIAVRWPAMGPIQASVEATQPTVSAQEVARAMAEFANPAMSGPVTVMVGTKKFTVRPAAYAPALSMKADGSGQLVPVVDQAKLVAAVRAASAGAGVESRPRDARITFKGATAVVVPSAPGVTLNDASVATSFLPALTSHARTAKVATTLVQPGLTTAQANAIKPKAVIGTFTTQFPVNPPRTANITLAAKTLNGTYVAPGGQFSLNGVLGERTAAKGYQKAPVIEGGRLTIDYGGGVSQLSTTLFNAAFFAGVRIDQYLPHSFYISRYPEGREATVSWPNVDQKWTNDTGYGILIAARVSGNSVTVSLYGTKVWDIKAVQGPRRNVVQPRTIVDASSSCVAQAPSPGFDVTVDRVFSKGRTTVRTSTFTTHYLPEDSVTCTHPKKP